MTAAGNNIPPIWEKALDSFRDNLMIVGAFQRILDARSIEDVSNDAKVLQPFGLKGKSSLEFTSRVKPTLNMVDDFSCMLDFCFGPKTVLLAPIWGSLRMILIVGIPILNLLTIILT